MSARGNSGPFGDEEVVNVDGAGVVGKLGRVRLEPDPMVAFVEIHHERFRLELKVIGSLTVFFVLEAVAEDQAV